MTSTKSNLPLKKLELLKAENDIFLMTVSGLNPLIDPFVVEMRSYKEYMSLASDAFTYGLELYSKRRCLCYRKEEPTMGSISNKGFTSSTNRRSPNCVKFVFADPLTSYTLKNCHYNAITYAGVKVVEFAVALELVFDVFVVFVVVLVALVFVEFVVVALLAVVLPLVVLDVKLDVLLLVVSLLLLFVAFVKLLLTVVIFGF